MATTASEVMAELQTFLHGFAHTVARIYTREALPHLLGCTTPEAEGAVPEACDFSGMYLWRSVQELTAFGIDAIPTVGLGGGPLDAGHADAELFFHGIEGLETLLAEDQVEIPRKVIRAVETAVARHVLEGGTRYADWELAEGGLAIEELTIREVALLADMDERSVRNACNPKLPDPLITKSLGKRTVVERADAKRWLQGRKSYVPLRVEKPAVPETQKLTLELPVDAAKHLLERAKSCGMSVEDYVVLQLVSPRMSTEAAKPTSGPSASEKAQPSRRRP